jgi:hypothetical protein
VRRFVSPLASALVLAASIAGGCGLFGGSSSDDTSQAPPASCDPTSAIDEGRRIEVMNAIDARFEALLAADPSTAIPQLVQYALGFCELTPFGNDGKTILVLRFRDGVLYALSDSSVPDLGDLSASHLPPPATPATPARKDHVGAGDHIASLPLGPRYVSLRGLDDTWRDPFRTIAAELEKAGYSKKSIDFTPRALKATGVLDDVGVLMIDTHGNDVLLGTGDSLDKYFSFFTGELAPTDKTAKPADDYAEDLRRGRITYMTERRSKHQRPMQRRYGITAKFVLEYLHPQPGLFVVADACRSLTPPQAPMADAFVARPEGTSAAAYLGWIWYVPDDGSEQVMLRAFNYLLGAHMGTDPPAIPTRPLDDVSTLQGLGQDLLTTGGATLGYAPHRADIVGNRVFDPIASIAPSIVRLRSDENAPDRLQILGDFGFPAAADGTSPVIDVTKLRVTIGGTDVTTLSGDYVQDAEGRPCTKPSEKGRCLGRLFVQLPGDGAGASGNVVVFVRGIRSNAVPYTQWKHLKIHEVQSTDGCPITLDWDLGLRADVHPYRETNATAVDTFVPPNGALLVSADSTLTYSISGTYTTGGVTYTCSGSGTAKLVPLDAFDSKSPVPQFYVRGTVVSTDQKLPKQAKLHLEGGVDGLQRTISGSDGSSAAGKTVGGLPFLELTLADDGTIQADTPTISDYTVSWTEVKPTGTVPTAATQQ